MRGPEAGALHSSSTLKYYTKLPGRRLWQLAAVLAGSRAVHCAVRAGGGNLASHLPDCHCLLHAAAPTAPTTAPSVAPA